MAGGHGMRKSRVYQTWVDMVRRCRDPRRQNFRLYGGRGILMCDRWLKFEAFYADMGDQPAGMTLERRDSDGHYEPRNCRWATNAEQQLNKRTNHLLLVQGCRLPLAEAARRYGLPESALSHRVRAGWSDERAVLQPLRVVRRRRVEA